MMILALLFYVALVVGFILLAFGFVMLGQVCVDLPDDDDDWTPPPPSPFDYC